MLAAGIALRLLLLLARAVPIHRLIQSRVAPGVESGQVSQVVVDTLFGRGRTVDEVWSGAGLPLEALQDESRRHLPEVRALLRRMDIAAWLLTAAGSRPRSSRSQRATAMKMAGVGLFGMGSLGLVGTTVGFPLIWERYHELAYDSLDWQLDEGNILARLYPERFYRAAAILWLAGCWLTGLALLIVSDRQRD